MRCKERGYGGGGGDSLQFKWPGKVSQKNEAYDRGWSPPGKHTETIPSGETPCVVNFKQERARMFKDQTKAGASVATSQ